MAQTFVEDRLRFTFDDQWHVEKYDEHRDYLAGIGRLPATKAVDFLGILPAPEGSLFFIEVKDFRGYRIQNKQRMSDGELAIEIGQKVRDTIAGCLAMHRNSSSAESWKPLARGMYRTTSQIKVVLWLEEDSPHTPRERRAVRDNVLVKQIQQRLSWLTTKVMVASLARPSQIPGLVVTQIAQ